MTRLLWLLPVLVLSSAAPAQTTTGSTASGAVRGPGIPVVPNNSLPPLSGSSSATAGTTTAPGLTPTTPALTAPVPGLGAGTAPEASAGSTASTTPGVIIQLPPPSPELSSSPSAVRTCPDGATFC